MYKKSILWLAALFLVTSCGKKGEKSESTSKRPSDLPPQVHKIKKVNKTAVSEKVKKKDPKMEQLKIVKNKIKNFVPVKLTYPEKELTPELKKVVMKLIEASKMMDNIFLKQVSRKNAAYLKAINEEVKKNPEMKPFADYFHIMYGIWDRQDHDRPFWGKDKKPAGAGFYDEKLTKKVFETYLANLENALKNETSAKVKVKIEDELTRLKSLYTLVDRKNGKYITTPYSQAYKDELTKVAKLLKEAAELTKEASLKKYLTLRAEALLNDNYQKSDFAWLDVKGDIEFLIGPYEVYEDGLMAYKASFEAFVNIKDKEYSTKLEQIKKYRSELDKNLPYDDKYRAKRGKDLPIVVVDQLFTAGETKAGVQTLAFNLPNDETVRKKKGYKLVLFKNVSEAKYKLILTEIAKKLLNPEQQKLVTFDAFFTHTLLHEVTHGLGPAFIKQGNKKVEVRAMLKEHYTANEEAKADIGGLLALEYMTSKKLYKPETRNQGYATFVASIFRSIRFGATEAHGKANLMALNFLMNEKAVVFDSSSNVFTINFDKMPGACRKFVKELLKIQAEGDYNGAKAFEAKWAKMTSAIKEGIKKIKGIPIDIVPIYPLVSDKPFYNF